MLIIAPQLLILVHLGAELMLVAEEGVFSGGHILALFILLFPLSLDDLHVHLSIDSGILLHAGVVVSKLFLASHV